MHGDFGPPPRRHAVSPAPQLPRPQPAYRDTPQAGASPSLESEEPPASLPRPHNRRWRYVLVVLGLVLVSVAAVFGWGIWQLQPRDGDGRQRQVTIASGSTPVEIAQTLEREGIIRNAFVFRLYVWAQGRVGELKAGTYVFSPAQDVPDIVAYLVEGKVDALRITLIPGQTLREIEDSLVKYGFERTEVSAALYAAYDHPVLAGKPPTAGLEGYIFPDTYEIQGDGTVEDLVRKALDNFQQKLAESQLVAALQARNLTLYQAVTLASIIQEEVPTPAEQKQVAQVFLKRLAEDMPLGADPTFKYAAGLLGVPPSVNLDSPYNTRIKKGLPPGPIANFNLSALEAVAYPAPGDFLYFVAGDDGVTRFARTFEEHERNIERYCTAECARN